MTDARMSPGAGEFNFAPGDPFNNKIMPGNLLVGGDPWAPINERYDWPGVFSWLTARYDGPVAEVDIFVFDSAGLTDDVAARQRLNHADREVLEEVAELPEFLGYLSGTPDQDNNNRNRTLCFWIPGSRDVIRHATGSEAHRDAAAQIGAYDKRWPVRWRITNTHQAITFVELNDEWEPMQVIEQNAPVSARFIVACNIEA